MAYCDSNISIEAAIYDANDAVEDGNTRDIQGASWGVARSNSKIITQEPGAETDYSIFIKITGHGANTIRISIPSLVNDTTWLSNPAVQSMRPYIPGFYIAYDSLETDPDYPFLRLADVLTDAIADTMIMSADWFQYYAGEIVPGESKQSSYTRSKLTNYQFVREQYVDWLAQFSGTKQRKQIYYNSSAVVPGGEISAFKTAQLYPAIYGRGAGTQSAIRTAVEFVLSGTKSLVISQHVGGDPWAMKVITLASETPNIDPRTGVRVATTEDISIATELVSGLTIDGITLSNGDRVLVKDQSAASQNGVYTVSATPTRSTDFDSSGEIVFGALFIVSEGSVNADKAFSVTTTGVVNVGSTNINFAEFTGSPEVLAAAEPARPLGYSFTHAMAYEFTLTLGDSTFGRLGTAVL